MFADIKDSNPYAYYYNFLSPRQKHEYKTILKAIRNRDEAVFFPIPIRERSLMGVLCALMGDNHDLFWVDVNWILDHYLFAGNDTGLVFGLEMSYLMSMAEQREAEFEIQRISDVILNDVANLVGDLEKARYIFRWLASHATYIDMTEGPHSQTLKGALLDGATACAGFSHAMAYLCNRAGIDCKFVWGEYASGPHAWNQMELDGRSVYCDIASSLLPDVDGSYQPTEMFFAMSSSDLERFGLSFDFPETAPFAPDSDYTQWELSGGYRGEYDFDRCVWAAASARQRHMDAVYFAFENGGLTGFLRDFTGEGCDGIDAVSGICCEPLAWNVDYIPHLGVSAISFG